MGNSKAIKILEDNLEEKRQKLDLVIDKQIEKSFSVAYDNIDTFLDYHYSVIGEYSELIASATGSIAQDVKENLFGNEFISNMKKSQTLINDTYIENIRAHITEIDKQATKGISRSLNSDILTKLTSDIENRFSAQYIKLGSIIVAGTSIKVVSLVSAKIAAKSGGKLAAKLAAKTTLKTASAGTAAVAGAACGPFVWVCSPVAGLAAWFGTDAIIISGDEYFNRDDFKREIVQMLDKQKIELSTKVKNAYAEKLVTDSISIRRNYESTTIKREKISEKI